MRFALVAMTLLAACAPARAGSCDRFEDPLAYNACLAESGPKAYFGAATHGRAEPGEEHRRKSRHERSHMEFSPAD